MGYGKMEFCILEACVQWLACHTISTYAEFLRSVLLAQIHILLPINSYIDCNEW